MKFSKRKINKTILNLILIFIFILLFISIYFIQLNFNIHKKQISSILLQTKFNIINPVYDIKKANLKQAPQIIANQYNSNNWRIIIQKINLNAPILEGTSKENLRKGVGHFEDTGIEYRKYLSCSS